MAIPKHVIKESLPIEKIPFTSRYTTEKHGKNRINPGRSYSLDFKKTKTKISWHTSHVIKDAVYLGYPVRWEIGDMQYKGLLSFGEVKANSLNAKDGSSLCRSKYIYLLETASCKIGEDIPDNSIKWKLSRDSMPFPIAYLCDNSWECIYNPSWGMQEYILKWCVNYAGLGHALDSDLTPLQRENRDFIIPCSRERVNKPKKKRLSSAEKKNRKAHYGQQFKNGVKFVLESGFPVE